MLQELIPSGSLLMQHEGSTVAGHELEADQIRREQVFLECMHLVDFGPGDPRVAARTSLVGGEDWLVAWFEHVASLVASCASAPAAGSLYFIFYEASPSPHSKAPAHHTVASSYFVSSSSAFPSGMSSFGLLRSFSM